MIQKVKKMNSIIKSIVLFSIISLVLAFAFFNNVKVSANGSEAYLITTNPAENSNNSMNISWHCDSDTEKYIEYTLATDVNFENSYKQLAKNELETIYNSSAGGDSTSYKFQTTLINLKEDTEYIYRIVGKNTSDVKKFKTGGAVKYSAYILSDVHTYGSIASRLQKAETIYNNIKDMSYDMQLVVGVGDMVAYGTARNDWKALLNSSFVSENVYASTPGNHDYYNTSATFLDASYYNSNFNNPDNGAEGCLNTTYYFYYGNVLYISLNSEDACTNATLRENQRVWLENVLENNTAQFIVVYFHRSMYPGSGNNTGHATTMKNAYQAIFDKYGVDLVFGGHDHVYVRTNKIYAGTTTTVSNLGTQYVSTTQIGDRASKANSNMVDIAKKVGSVTGGILLSVDSENGDMMVRFYNENNELLDSVGVVSKSKSFKSDRYMRLNVKFSYEGSFSSLKLDYGTELFQKAYKVAVYEDGEEIKSVRPSYQSQYIEDLGASDIDKQKTYVVKIFMRDGTIYEKEYTIKNKEMDYGEISDLAYNDGVISWNATLKNDVIQKYEVIVNGYVAEFDKNSVGIAIAPLSKYKLNTIELKAYNNNDICVYSEQITYGEDIEIEYNYEPLISGYVNDEISIDITNSLNEIFTYRISANSDNVIIDNNKITAIASGTYDLNVYVLETLTEFKITLDIKNTYIVILDDGLNKESIKVKEGEKVSKPLDPVKVGFVFTGWYLNDKAYDFETVIIENITLVAKFEEAKYKVTFDVDGKLTTSEVKYNEKVSKPLDPVKDGFVFTSWYLNDKVYDFETIIIEDITLVAGFKQAKYIVTFDVDGKLTTSEVKYNEKVSKPVDPVKEGFKFLGWYVGDKELETLYDFETIVTSDITLVAKFEEVSAKNNGCNASSILWLSITLLGLCLIRRKF